MLSKLFNWLKSQDSTNKNQEENILASITYYIKEGSTKPSVNIELDNYDEDCCEAMCDILDTISSDGFYIETFNIMKTALLKEKREDVLLYILTRVGDKIRDEMLKKNEDSIKDEPCIKPSDTLQ